MGKLMDMLKKPSTATQEAAPIPKLTITFAQRKVEINGIEFVLLKSDADILDDALRLIDASEKLDTTNQRAVLQSLRDMASYVDTVLGDGALKRISGGVPVGFVDLQRCMRVIVGAVYEAYQTNVASNYAD